jgi:NAD(P)-dependent dehydrogenase (short-subunit alcohol dehydrogenase family)
VAASVAHVFQNETAIPHRHPHIPNSGLGEAPARAHVRGEGHVYRIGAALPMKAQRSAHIINVSSVAGQVADRSAVYAAIKTAPRVS